ncbi:glyoxylate/hydroxypyruvate reductase A [Actimicrobium sp. GrIS 1.19]|uniref:2-hydroxyacid dehydrogenase n=1 Tax=Actimicrobium sp. GrIS 1.19 TaxID=3071708 RepID=UPI002E01E31C|nr:glyoxylate/hydroxypyruvate reductase A [Actimicrobium sp. GrIS 1.19]
MEILVYAHGSSGEEWLADLQRALPLADVRLWREGDQAAADYAVVWRPPAEMLRGRADLKAIFNLGAGVDAILQLGEALPDVPVVRLDDAGMGVQMAEYVTHAVLRYFRRFDEFDAQSRDHQWRFLKPRSKEDFCIGILGMGVLGSRIAEALQHFDFPVHGWSRSRKEIAGVHSHAGTEELETFLSHSQVLVCVLPLTDDTSGILDYGTLAHLPKGAFLINVARGAHLVERDLLQLLEDGHLAGATLDVFHDEPLPSDHPFWREPRITITPHIAALTQRGDSIRQIAAKIKLMERGQPIAGLVDRTKGY